MIHYYNKKRPLIGLKKVMNMKKKMLAVLFIVLGLSCILPAAGFAWTGGPGVHRSGRVPYRHHGWYRPRVYVGASFVNPWYIPPPVYIYSPPVIYSEPVPPPVYAYPDPGLTGQYTGGNPPGQWVTVPGQWVDGKWIPSHRAWVAVNP
jgi:hypothetical protein